MSIDILKLDVLELISHGCKSAQQKMKKRWNWTSRRFDIDRVEARIRGAPLISRLACDAMLFHVFEYIRSIHRGAQCQSAFHNRDRAKTVKCSSASLLTVLTARAHDTDAITIADKRGMRSSWKCTTESCYKLPSIDRCSFKRWYECHGWSHFSGYFRLCKSLGPLGFKTTNDTSCFNKPCFARVSRRVS